MSLWVELYQSICADTRFSQMLGQPGSTPLDLFKFYVEDLKSRYTMEKKVIKEILREKNYDLKATTTFEEFATMICEDNRSATLDAGNVKLTFNSLLEKAEAKEKERQKEESRKLRKLETNFRTLLAKMPIESTTPWETARPELEKEPEFEAIPHEYERARIYKEFMKDLEESCTHSHSKRKKRSKKSKKHRRSSSVSSEDDRKRSKSRRNDRDRDRNRHSDITETSESDSDSHRRKKSKKSKRSRNSPPPPPAHSGNYSSEGERSEGEHRSSSKKSKKSSRKNSPSPPPEKKSKKDKSPGDKKDKSSGEASIEEGELSEEELLQKRSALLKELEGGV